MQADCVIACDIPPNGGRLDFMFRYKAGSGIRLLSTSIYRMAPPVPGIHVAKDSIDVWSLINNAAADTAKSTGEPVVNLGQGFFSYAPPKFATDAVKEALDTAALNQYAPTKGRPELLEALSKVYSPFFHKKLDPASEILVTAGANEGILSSFFAFLNQGDEVIVFEPFFDQYIPNIQMAGGKVVYVPIHPPKDCDTTVSSANNWYIDFNELEQAITPKTKMIVLNTPHNPIGKVLTKDELTKIGDLCVKHNIVIVSDEVYDRLYYSQFDRIANVSQEVRDLTLTVGSAGKTFAATGWRVGWVIGPAHLIKYVARANTRVVFSTNTPCQWAVAKSFAVADEVDFYNKTIESFKQKYAILCSVFDELGLPYSIAEGGYFLLVNFKRVKIPEGFEFDELIQQKPRDFKLAIWMIKALGVVAIPPTEFTTPKTSHLLENWLRFAVCKDDSILHDAAERLRGLKQYIE